MLKTHDIQIAAHILSIGGIEDTPFDPANVDCSASAAMVSGAPPVLNPGVWEQMLKEIGSARKDGDSVGGVIECAATGLPVGLGGPMFEGVENRIAAAVFAIPAVKGISFGSGFDGSHMRGSRNNDAFTMDGTAVITKTNNHGGILGGITSGMPLIFRTAVKPTPSIALEQDSVSLKERKNAKLRIRGRHDPCIVPRAVPCVEAAAAIALCDMLLDSKQTIGD